MERHAVSARHEHLHLCSGHFYRRMYYGAAKSERPEHFEDVDFIVQHFEILSIDPALEAYGRLKYQLEKQGQPIDDFDLLIGAIAKQSSLILVTHNTRHFSHIPELMIEDWLS